MKRLLCMISAVMAALCPPAASATGSLAELTVVDRTDGRTLPVHRHLGRHFVAGRPGAEYLLTLRNRTGEDLLAVVSVDGVNVVTGETAHWSQSGYVLRPGGTCVSKVFAGGADAFNLPDLLAGGLRTVRPDSGATQIAFGRA